MGQDEAVFKSKTYSKKVWAVEGKQPLLSKNEGPGTMVSAFQAALFGFGYAGITPASIARVNVVRRQLGKADITDNPFLVFFDYGANADGYWDGEKMGEQTDQCLDCCDVLHPEFQFVGQFDHSAGHGKKKKEGGLDSGNMNLYWGGRQGKAAMRDAIMIQGSLGDKMDAP